MHSNIFTGEFEEKFEPEDELFRLLVSSIQDYAIFMTDPGGFIISWNEGAKTIKGYEEQEVIGKHISIFYRSEDIQHNEPAYNLRMARQEGHFESEGWRVRKNGFLFWANVIFTPLYYENGELRGFAKITRDITRRKNEEDKFKSLLDSAPDAMVIADENGKILLTNQQAEILFQYKKEEMAGQQVEILMPAALRERHIIHRSHYTTEPRVRAMGAGLELFAIKKDGTLFPVEISLSPLTTSVEGRLVVAAIRDITERRKADEKFKGLLESAPDAMVIADQQGTITLANRQSELMFGYSKHELIGQPVEILIPSALRQKHQENRVDYFRESKVRSMGAGLDLYAVKKDGSSFPVEISLSPLLTSEGKLVVAAIRDITEKKKADNLLNQFNEELSRQVEEKTFEINNTAEQLRLLSAHLQLIREEERVNMAREIHDQLGQMLTGLKMDISWLLKEVNPGNETVRIKFRSSLVLLDEIVKTVRRISTELHPGILEDLGLVAALEWQSHEFEKRSAIKVLFNATADEIKVTPSASIGIFRIFQESLTNVARHSGATRVNAALKLNGEFLELTVADDGKGFDPSVKSSRKTMGLLGMSERALMMKGKWEVTSSPGKGATVKLSVPVQAVTSK